MVRNFTGDPPTFYIDNERGSAGTILRLPERQHQPARAREAYSTTASGGSANHQRVGLGRLSTLARVGRVNQRRRASPDNTGLAHSHGL